jgi:hypothetical protein
VERDGGLPIYLRIRGYLAGQVRECEIPFKVGKPLQNKKQNLGQILVYHVFFRAKRCHGLRDVFGKCDDLQGK